MDTIPNYIKQELLYFDVISRRTFPARSTQRYTMARPCLSTRLSMRVELAHCHFSSPSVSALRLSWLTARTFVKCLRFAGNGNFCFDPYDHLDLAQRIAAVLDKPGSSMAVQRGVRQSTTIRLDNRCSRLYAGSF